MLRFAYNEDRPRHLVNARAVAASFSHKKTTMYDHTSTEKSQTESIPAYGQKIGVCPLCGWDVERLMGPSGHDILQCTGLPHACPHVVEVFRGTYNANESGQW